LWAAAGALALIAIAAVLVTLDVGGLRSRLSRAASTPAPAIRLAVLPFANLSGDAGQEYLSDGLTQDMITLLGRLHPGTLSVIARTSVMRYKKGDISISRIGRDLGVQYILKGSAQRLADRVRITAELVKVADQAQVWADTYERDLSAILAVQGQVAQGVARALAIERHPADQARRAVMRTINPEVYEAYLKGSALWQTLKAADIDAAQRYLEQALVKDPSYAPVYQGLTWVWLVRLYTGVAPRSVAGPKAKAAALQALALDENSAEAHEALAAILSWSEWDWARADPEWRRALELNPSGANAHAYYAHHLAAMGRADEALPHSERAIELDPFNALYHGMYAMVLDYLRRWDDALVEARKALSLQPDLGIANDMFQRVYVNKGMRKEQLAEQRMRVARDPERLAAFERGLADGGYEGAQRAIANVYVGRYEKGQYKDAMGVAFRFLDGGDKDRAMDWLEKAYEAREPGLVYVGRPHWDRLRGDPRFQDLLRRIGLPQ
jgi:TolB-like protein/Tfp pilus assembly protein PilF